MWILFGRQRSILESGQRLLAGSPGWNVPILCWLPPAHQERLRREGRLPSPPTPPAHSHAQPHFLTDACPWGPGGVAGPRAGSCRPHSEGRLHLALCPTNQSPQGPPPCSGLEVIQLGASWPRTMGVSNPVYFLVKGLAHPHPGGLGLWVWGRQVGRGPGTAISGCGR